MKKKLLALFLCCALSFGLVTAALITPASADEDFLVYGSDGLVAHTVQLANNNKLALTAVASTGSVGGRSDSGLSCASLSLRDTQMK